MNNKQTETKWKSGVDLARRLIRRVLYFGALSLICPSAPAQNLFVASDAAGNISDTAHGNIYEFTPNGVRSTFASGLIDPEGLAFDSMGNLFVADPFAGAIYKFTPAGVRSTFASGLDFPGDLAFDTANNLFVADSPSHAIYKFTSDG